MEKLQNNENKTKSSKNNKFSNMKSNRNNSITGLKYMISTDTNLSSQQANKAIIKFSRDFSMKLINNDYNLLDYTFTSYRKGFSNITNLNDQSVYNYMSDLNDTLLVNFECVSKLINNFKDDSEKESLISLFNTIQKKYQEKKEKINDIRKRNSILLIERQIIEQTKRKNEETLEYYKEKIKDAEDNLQGKIDYITMFKKKLLELEIYIQKNTKKLVDGPYVKYKGWKVYDFIDKNTIIMRKRDMLAKEKINLQQMKEEITSDNTKFREENKKNSISKFNKLNDFNDKDKAVNEYIEMYKKNIGLYKSKIQILSNLFKGLNSTLKYLTLEKDTLKNVNSENQNFFKTKQVNNIIGNVVDDNENEKDKSLVPLDLTKKLNTFMDFSIILNKKAVDDKQHDESKFNESKFNDLGKTIQDNNDFGNVSKSLWDISCI